MEKTSKIPVSTINLTKYNKKFVEHESSQDEYVLHAWPEDFKFQINTVCLVEYTYLFRERAVANMNLFCL